ncbi:MAG: ABC transporter permease [Candidatus Komeilibacteria bacterium]|nr:ABC transporter permease [Candidatus Komeilibacteria bacterium]
MVGLRTNKSRTILTILGITIGITAIITVMSLGQGAQNLILGQVQSIGAKVLTVAPGRHPSGASDFISTFTDSLKNRDLDALQRKENVPHLARIMPILFGSDSATFENNIHRPTIFGVTSMFADIYDIYPSEGRIFSDEEVKGYADVVIIGSKVKEELFGENQALGQKIKIKGKSFKIIGLLSKKGSSSFINFDDAAIIPYTTAQQYIFGIKYFHRLVVEADEEINVDQTVADVEATLRASHSITDPDKDDFFVETQADAMEMVGTITNVLTLFLAAIAAISLLVGGVGIMNIMLVSVTERTREIGLRKAIGATDANILTQFLLESVILTCLGGVLGITFGAAISLLASVVLTQVLNQSWGFTVPLTAVLLGLGVSAFIGLVFGLYPARQAAKKSPIEALRYE